MDIPDRALELDPLSASASDLRSWRDKIVGLAIEQTRRSDVRAAIKTLRRLEFATIDSRTLELTDPMLPQIAAGRMVVATFDPRRSPSADEVVIIYGNYPHIFSNVVVNNPVKRHVADFWTFRHDAVEYDRRWDAIDQILIINVDERSDRWDAVLRELAMAKAPIDRAVRVAAARPPVGMSGEVAGTVACLRSHIKALHIARDAGAGHVLVLEDDFSFTSDLEMHLTDLATFFRRGYDYWICLMATSKYGAVVPIDDLVARSYQECTNAAGYLVSQTGLERLVPVFENAAERLVESLDTLSYAADRCWAVLQPSGKFLVFRRKIGFQAASFSDIYRSISRYLD